MNSEQIAEFRKQRYNATLTKIHRTHSDLMILRVTPDFKVPVHKAGQYTSLGLGYWEARHPETTPETVPAGTESQLVKRAYSIGCSVVDDNHQLLDITASNWLEFYIVLVRESSKDKPPAFTPRLFMLQEGDRIFLSEKITGHFTLDPVQPGDTVIFLSTGTGEAPHNYMLWELLCRGHTGRILSACCVRYRRDLAYLAIHDELMRRFPSYIYLSLATREADTINNKVYIQDLISSGQMEEKLGQTLNPASTHVYLCGNPSMIGVPQKDRETGQRTYPKPLGVIEILESRGFQTDQPQAKIKGNIHFEEYW